MRIKRFDAFWQLTLLPKTFPVNVYLVPDEDGLTLIDTAIPLAASGILKAVKRLGKPVTTIALTHAHYDHIGSLDKLSAAFPEATVALSTRESFIAAGDLAPREGELATADGKIPGSYYHPVTTPNRLLDDGGRVGSLSVIATPGHTPGHLSFFHETSGTLFTGDALQTRAGLAVAGDPRLLFPFVAWATWDKQLAWDSAQSLAELPIRRLATGHGEILDDPKKSLQKAITRAEARLS